MMVAMSFRIPGVPNASAGLRRSSNSGIISVENAEPKLIEN